MAFAISSAVVWNSLPTELRVSSLTVATFARHLKTHLFSCLNERIWGFLFCAIQMCSLLLLLLRMGSIVHQSQVPRALRKWLNRLRCHWGVDSGGPKELCIWWGPDPPSEGAFLRQMTLGFSCMLPSTVPSGPDIGISPHAVDQRSCWLSAEVWVSHWIFPTKNPAMWCGVSSKFFNHFLF